MPNPVLVVLHQECSTPGRVGQFLQARGIPLDIRRPRYGDRLPETLAEHAGAIVFGGPMSANDPDDFVKTEIDWLAVPLAEQKPLLGICLGAQMLAKQLGARVAPHPDGHVEVGYYPLRVTLDGRRVCGPWPGHVYQWHREGFELPAGARLLAEGDTFRNQAFRYGPAAYGLQFHPEVTHAMMCRWTTRGHERLSLPGAKPRLAHFADRPVYDGAVRAWLSAFLDAWLAPAQPAAHSEARAEARPGRGAERVTGIGLAAGPFAAG
ncbi:GMP synthase [glutamine-hydrolyzing] [Rhodoplanes serenus]|uniref:GMP synthase [glutamine-hydrolyzing] n=1 Tax=Rhodoplanes serenus TaxID=200615 RepID=A0A3S4FD29_9BRAD|nr:glutamine amidotransferase [Rhodoplanes serenus]MBI5111369.1 glutamine amidotransferase [Rhodovulum sp.]VCU11450.1 GMP synthase [glutamine-hydrolyzing] [Rhodoplanes serenus]